MYRLEADLDPAVMPHVSDCLTCVCLCVLCGDRAEGRGGGEQQLSEQRESVRYHQRPAGSALLPPGEQLHGDEVSRAQRASVHRDQPAAVQHGHLTQR